MNRALEGSRPAFSTSRHHAGSIHDSGHNGKRGGDTVLPGVHETVVVLVLPPQL